VTYPTIPINKAGTTIAVLLLAACLFSSCDLGGRGWHCDISQRFESIPEYCKLSYRLIIIVSMSFSRLPRSGAKCVRHRQSRLTNLRRVLPTANFFFYSYDQHQGWKTSLVTRWSNLQAVLTRLLMSRWLRRTKNVWSQWMTDYRLTPSIFTWCREHRRPSCEKPTNITKHNIVAGRLPDSTTYVST